MLAEERHIQIPDRRRLHFDAIGSLAAGTGRRVRRRAAVRTGGERRMVEEGDDVAVAIAVQTIELIAHPGELEGIGGNVRVERDHEHVAEAKRVSWITR